MANLTQTQIDDLQSYVSNGDRLGYWTALAAYQQLQGQDARYALLALGVAGDNTASGQAANAFLRSAAAQQSVTLSTQNEYDLGVALMTADFDTRNNISGASITLTEIRDYHGVMFGTYGLTIEAWTAYNILEVMGDGYWDDLLNANSEDWYDLGEEVGIFYDISQEALDGNEAAADWLATAIATHSPTNSLFASLGLPSPYIGTTGSGTVFGTENDDLIFGADGNNTIFGSEGDDIIYGGAGTDSLSYIGLEEGQTLSSQLVESDHYSQRLVIQESGLFNFFADYNPFYNIDRAYSIENIQLTNENDIVSLNVGNFSGLVVDTAGGDDVVFSSATGIEYYLGDGDDRVYNVGNASIIHTGDGEDRIEIGRNIYITDASADDRLTYFGITLTGGLKPVMSESAWTLNGLARFSMNEVGDLVVRPWFSDGEYTYVANYHSELEGPGIENTAGILIGEITTSVSRLMEAPPEWDIIGTMRAWGYAAKAYTGTSPVKGVDPLVLDLDGNGFELSAQTILSPFFDIDGDNFAERTGWTHSGDGFLVRDVNSNGQIDDLSEMFGNDTTSGFSALAALDSDSNGVMNALDTDWTTLKIWIDADNDAITDSGELKTLAQLNIESITLTPTTTTPATVNGNEIKAQGTFTYVGGATGTIGDVDFMLDNNASTWLENVTITSGAEALPELKGYGTLPSLRQAMSYDTAFETIVANNIGNLDTVDMNQLRTAVMPILLGWMDAVPVASGKPGTSVNPDVPIIFTTDADGGASVVDFAYKITDGLGDYWVFASERDVLDSGSQVITRPTYQDILDQIPGVDEELAVLDGDVISFMERWADTPMGLGTENLSGSESIVGAKSMIDMVWHEWNSIIVKLAAQDPSALGDYFASLEYNPETDKFEPTTDYGLVPALEAIFDDAPRTSLGDAEYLASWKPFLDILIDDLDRGQDYLVASYSYLFQNLVAAYESVGLAISITDAAAALDIPDDLIIIGSGSVGGTEDADIFYMDSSNQTVTGGDGRDAYVFGENFGTDVVVDIEETTGRGDDDILRFSQYLASEITATRDGDDLILTVTGTSHSVTVVDQFAIRRPGLTSGYIDHDKGINEIIFADGTVWDALDIAKAVSHPEATNDTIIGTGSVDYLDGGEGDDTLSGRDEGDVYIYGTGYGHDIVFEDPYTEKTILLDAYDIVHFKNLNLEDVEFTRNGGSDHLIITTADSADTLTIQKQFDAFYTGILGVEWLNRIEGFSFQNGQTLLWSDIFNIVISNGKTEGNDIIYGFAWEDTLDGGTGNDYLAGGYEGDDYIWGTGYDNDTIADEEYPLSTGDDIDRVLFTVDLLPADISVIRNGYEDDLVLRIDATGETLTLKDQTKKYATGAPAFDVEEFVFADTTVWTEEDVRNLYLSTAATSGADTIIGFWSNDIIDGSAGNDILKGKGGSDTYLFDIGSGNDVIEDYIQLVTLPDSDTIDFGSIASTDATFTKSGNNLVITFAGISDSITVNKQYFGSSNLFRIENFVFSNTTLNSGDVYNLVYFGGLPNVINGTNSNETLNGTSGIDHIFGLDGNDTINAGDGADVLHGGNGNDTLKGSSGNDTYIFSDGSDLIDDTGGTDTIVFDSSVTLGDLTIYREQTSTISAAAMIIELGGHRTNIYYHFNGRSVETLEFYDGSTYSLMSGNLVTKGTSGNDNMSGISSGSVFNANDVMYGLDGNDDISGNDGDDIIYGGNGHDEINGDDGNDTIYGEAGDDELKGSYGNDIIYGGDGNDIIETDSEDDYADGGTGNDTIWADSGNDILIGGAGNDILRGGAGDDRYIYHSGYDFIEKDSSANGGVGGTDTLFLDLDIDIYDLSFSRNASDNDDSDITIVPSQDWIRVDEHFASSNFRLEYLEFRNGMKWSYSIDPQTWTNGTSSGETINGNSSANSILGWAGNDTINAGDGNDQLEGGAGNDTLYGGNGADYLFDAEGSDSLYGEAGDDILTTYDANGDTLDGGSGADKLYGGAGNDLLYGQDGLDELTGNDGADTFIFAAASAFNNIDFIHDFSMAEGDKIDISDLLAAYDPLTDAIEDFVRITDNGTDSILEIDANGEANSFVQIATLKGIVGITDEALLETNGSLII